MFDIGSKIRHFRELKGYSQEDMAQLLKVSLKTYTNLETNTTKTFDPNKIKKIAQILETDWIELVSYGEKVTILSGNTETTNQNNHICLYPSSQALAHENEKLHLENGFLKKEIDFLKSEIQNLKEINALLKTKNG